jgi:hypothetical protein
MGAGIAEVSAVAGMPVVVRDLPQFLDAAQGRVEKSLAGAVKRGKLDQAAREQALARITFTPDLKDVASADIVIEAVPEILDLKVSLIKELDDLVSPDTVIATNTSSIPIAELAGKVQPGSPGTSTWGSGRVRLPGIGSNRRAWHDDNSFRAGAGHRACPGDRLLPDERPADRR